MRIVILGAGGLGGYLGARLAQSGHDVTFVARGEHLAALQRDGLRVESSVAPLHLQPVVATDRIESVGPADVVVVAVKLWDTEAAIAALKPALTPQTMIVSFQNGVDAAQRIGAIAGAQHVIGGIAYIAASIAAPGVVRHAGALQRFVFGELDGRASDRVSAFAAACTAAGLDAETSDAITRLIWEKFVFIVGLSGATCLFRSSIGPIRTNPRSRALLLAIMRETVDVGRAQGAALDAAFADQRLAFVDTLPEGMIASMYGDLQRGTRLELPWLSGTVADLGEASGVPVPVNRFVTDALALDVNGRSAT